ncbi:hypothetical protein [Bacteroides acidifaciens]|uniref:hypothetical protein n=1 Tax=Bacteroides acidifaciens TaxID=85831 RepID=UPI0025AEAB6A|nr:hypothetical protein [Bacteroides acidifaciens]
MGEIPYNAVTKMGYLYSPKIIPLAYEDSLSYIEQVYSIIAKVNDLIDSINNMELDFTTISKEYIDEQVSAVKEWVALTNNQFQNQLTNQVNTDIQNFKDEMDTKFSSLQGNVAGELYNINQKLDDLLKQTNISLEKFNVRIAEIAGNVNKNNDFLLDYFKKVSDELKQLIEDAMSYKTGNMITVMNPTTNRNSTLNKALADMYEEHLLFGVTAEQYDNMDLTAELYDSLEITASEFDYNGLFYLFDYLYMAGFRNELKEMKEYVDNEIVDLKKEVANAITMHSPFTGEIDTVQNIITLLAQFHMYGSLTAQEYDDKELTAQAYDDLELTAYVFDWQGID